MGVQSTVVFADLFGSTGVFESLGNAKATEAVTQVTSWVAGKFTEHGGNVVKFLGDGVLATFKDSPSAISAVVDLQRAYQVRLSEMSASTYMPLRIGVVRGDVEIVANDCYGDAVNMAARLSELTGQHQIWMNGEALEDGLQTSTGRFRFLGPIHIRGRSEPCNVYQVEWQEDVNSELFTVQASFPPEQDPGDTDFLGGQIDLVWLELRKTFKAFEMPINIGRTRVADFVVNDGRVSRTHAKIVWRNGSVVLVDVSSFGCWVRFAGAGSDLLLRREECVLHGEGEIALGTPFSDPSASVIKFTVR